jgi:hypothetical protein
MKGTDVSEEARDGARQFLKIVSGVDWPEDQKHISITRNEFIRLLAWYGEIRAKGGLHPGRPVRIEVR